jgi:hypothetical protein
MTPEAWLVGELGQCGAGERVYRRRLPETVVLPAFSYTRITTVGEYTHDGDSDLPTIRFQVDCWADDPDAADVLAIAAKGRLSGTRGPGGQPSAVYIDNDAETDDDESRTYRRVLDVMITWAGELEGS